MYNEFLEKTEYVDYDDLAVKSLAERLRTESSDELSLMPEISHGNVRIYMQNTAFLVQYRRKAGRGGMHVVLE